MTDRPIIFSGPMVKALLADAEVEYDARMAAIASDDDLAGANVVEVAAS